MKTRKIPEETFWKDEGHKHIRPVLSIEFIEDFDIINIISNLTEDYRRILEIGCGDGRLATAFSLGNYLGLDINPAIIEIAKSLHPSYSFQTCNYHDTYPFSDLTLLSSVLFHVPDQELEETILNITERTAAILTIEIHSREWRKPTGTPPTFNREEEEYIELFKRRKFYLSQSIKKPYTRHLEKGRKNNNFSFNLYKRGTKDVNQT